MKDKIAERDTWNLLNRLRGYIVSEHLLPVAIAIYKTKKLNFNDDAKIFETLVDELNLLNAYKAFESKDDALSIYKLFPKKFDWSYFTQKYIEIIGRRSPITLLPDSLINLMEKGLSQHPKSALIVEGEHFVSSLENILKNNPKTEFVITTQNNICESLLKIITEGYKNVRVCISDVYNTDFINEKFDYIIASPAFGLRTLSEDKTFICHELEFVALENLLTHLNGEGELSILLSGKITFSKGRIETLRNFIQNTYTIKEIDKLPTGVLSNTAIQTYLINFQNLRSTNNDISIKKFILKNKKNNDLDDKDLVIDDETFVMTDELEVMGSWNIDRIFDMQSEEWQAYSKSNVNREILKNVAEIFRGKNIAKKDSNGKIGVINISNIGDYEINKDNLDFINEEKRKVANYILENGDVLIPGRGTSLRAVVFHEDDFTYPCIASSNVIVIRPNTDELNSVYLKIFLDSPIGKKLVSQAQQGTVVMNLSYKDLNEIEILLPDIDEQNKIADKYKTEFKKYQETIHQAESRWKDTLKDLENF